MKNITILLLIFILFFINGCTSSCMQYRSATTAARSENNLQRAEKFGLDALGAAECNPDTNAWIPYFLAKEVYLVQKNYIQMAKMLNIAEETNPKQPLEYPYKLGETPIETIGEGVEALRDYEWGKLFNKAVILFNKKKYNKAEKQLKLCLVVHPDRIENYPALVDIYIQNENNDLALETIEAGINIDPKHSYLNRIKADFSYQNEDFETARELYRIAIENSDNPGPMMRKLLFIYIDLGENQQAIDYSNELMDKYPDDPDLYYNVGVLYQRLTVEIFDPTRDLFLITTVDSDPSTISEVYNSFKTARQYAYNSKDYFLQASDLELEENISTAEAVSEMRKLMDQIDDLFIPSIRETARSAGIELN